MTAPPLQDRLSVNEVGAADLPAEAVGEACLTVDLNGLAENYRTLVELAAPAEVAPVVKADAYGLGAGPVGRRLWHEGARRFFVARVSEGEQLRRWLGPGRSAVIYVLDGCPHGAGERLQLAHLTPVLNSLEQIQTWARLAVSGRPRAALHIDTGMNRLGLSVGDARVYAARVGEDAPELELVLSHLASDGRPGAPAVSDQARRFAEIAELFPNARKSLSNSGGLFLDPSLHLDLVRPGISLFGGGPFGKPDARLREVVALHAPILQVRDVAAGESVGYGAAFRATRPLRIAIVGAGYADGVLRAASPGGYGWLQGRRCAFVGRVSMDLIALDVTDCRAARPGALVEMLGPNVMIDDLARACGTISYEILTRLGARTPRRYIGAPDIGDPE